MVNHNLTPEQVGRMTMPQLLCMGSDKPPSNGAVIRSFKEYEEYVRAEEAAWSADPT